MSLVHITGVVPEAKREAAKEFVDAVMDATYKGACTATRTAPSSDSATGFKKKRHLLLLVNPKSGPVSRLFMFAQSAC